MTRRANTSSSRAMCRLAITRSKGPAHTSLSLGGNWVDARSSTSPPATSQKSPPRGGSVFSPFSAKCLRDGSWWIRATWGPPTACSKSAGRSERRASVSARRGRMEIHRPTSSRSRGPNPHERPSSCTRDSQSAGYCREYTLAGCSNVAKVSSDGMGSLRGRGPRPQQFCAPARRRRGRSGPCPWTSGPARIARRRGCPSGGRRDRWWASAGPRPCGPRWSAAQGWSPGSCR